MKYGISFCLTALAVIAMLVSACGGGGGAPAPAPAPQSPQAVVFIALTTSFSQKNLTILQFQLQSDQLATTFTNFSSNAVAINGATGAFIESHYDQNAGVNNIALLQLSSFPTSARQPFIKIIYTRGSGLLPKFNLYTTGLVSPITSLFENNSTVKPSNFRITVQYL